MTEMFKEILLFESGGAIHRLISVTVWLVLLTLGYFILFPVIWERKFKDYRVQAIVLEKRFYTTTSSHWVSTGNNTGYTNIITHYHYDVIFNLKDPPLFLDKTIKDDVGESIFENIKVNDDVVVTVIEKKRRFRFGSSDKFEFYGWELNEIVPKT